MNLDLRNMIATLLGQPERKAAPQLSGARPSKHMRQYRMTKAYADGRQKAPHNRRNLRKRKH